MQERDLVYSRFSPVLTWLSGVRGFGRIGLRLALKTERGPFYSGTARRIMALRYGVTIGAYSYGACFIPAVFSPNSRIGRYVSLAQGIYVFRRNHPMDRLSTHPFFYNRNLGFVAEDNVEFRPLSIEHDAWVGERAIITPGCQRIGIGAVVGAGAVVTKDVPDFAVVAGVPARLIKYRFSTAIRERILVGQWWNKPITEVAQHLAEMVRPLSEENLISNPWLVTSQVSVLPPICGDTTAEKIA